jgi:spoIIIJ-associated protein
MDKIELIKTEAEALLGKIVDTFEIDVTEDKGIFHVTIKTEAEAPVVIGRHGETIKAIQKILEVVLYKKVGESVEILVNVNDYREKQLERLHELSAKYAQKTLDFKSPSYIRGLSSYERKMVHEYITHEYPELSSYSTGEGRDRRLVIDLKEHVPQTTETQE